MTVLPANGATTWVRRQGPGAHPVQGDFAIDAGPNGEPAWRVNSVPPDGVQLVLPWSLAQAWKALS